MKIKVFFMIMRSKALDIIKSVWDSEDMPTLAKKDQAFVYCLLAVATAIIYVGDEVNAKRTFRKSLPENLSG